MEIYRVTTADAKKSFLDDFDNFDDKQTMLKEFDLLEHEEEDLFSSPEEDFSDYESVESMLKEFNI